MTRKIPELLEELRLTYERLGQAVSASLRPGIPVEELKERCSWFPHPLPDELLALYGWRGGQDVNDDNHVAPFWFRDVVFITPERAKREYESIMETYGAGSSIGMDKVDIQACFPFAAFSGSWYVFPCGSQNIRPDYPHAILNVYHGYSVLYYSLEKMLETRIECANDPGYLEQNWRWHHVESDIWEKHNPGVFSTSTLLFGGEA